MKTRLCTQGIRARRRRWSAVAILCVASLAAVWSAASATEIGTLSAERRAFTWAPVAGDTLRGPHDDLGLMPEDRSRLKVVFTDSGLVSAGKLISPDRLVLTTTVADPNHVSILFRSIDSLPAGGSDLRWRAGQSVAVAADEFWPGTVFAFDGAVSIRGEVGGDVIAIGADVTVGEAATVRGAVVVIGGILRQRGDAKIYGTAFAPGGHRRPRLSVTRAWEFEESGFQWAPTFSYDRVDGARTGVTVELKRSPYSPHLKISGAYAFASETWQYQLEVRQRLLRQIDLEAGATVFRLTRTDDDRWVGRTPNTVYALVAGSDYRDYYGADGGGLSLTYKYRERGVLTLAYENVDYRSLDAHRELWHLFRPGHPFRANFSTLSVTDQEQLPGLKGRSSAMMLTTKVEPVQTGRPESGFNGGMSAVVEVAGGGLGGNYDYNRLQLETRGWWTSGWSHRIAARAFYGVGRRDLPPNKLFYLGGVGSLPGYSQKLLVGDEAFLLNVEYRFNYWETRMFDGGILLFFDLGRAACDRHFWDWDQFKPDVGVGVALGEEVRLDIAKGLDETHRDIRVSVRLAETL
jgi:hypothetical protein